MTFGLSVSAISFDSEAAGVQLAGLDIDKSNTTGTGRDKNIGITDVLNVDSITQVRIASTPIIM